MNEIQLKESIARSIATRIMLPTEYIQLKDVHSVLTAEYDITDAIDVVDIVERVLALTEPILTRKLENGFHV